MIILNSFLIEFANTCKDGTDLINMLNNTFRFNFELEKLECELSLTVITRTHWRTCIQHACSRWFITLFLYTSVRFSPASQQCKVRIYVHVKYYYYNAKPRSVAKAFRISWQSTRSRFYLRVNTTVLCVYARPSVTIIIAN
jgi:hypothetical protein